MNPIVDFVVALAFLVTYALAQRARYFKRRRVVRSMLFVELSRDVFVATRTFAGFGLTVAEATRRLERFGRVLSKALDEEREQTGDTRSAGRCGKADAMNVKEDRDE